jgi:hypothetical protein
MELLLSSAAFFISASTISFVVADENQRRCRSSFFCFFSFTKARASLRANAGSHQLGGAEATLPTFRMIERNVKEIGNR